MKRRISNDELTNQFSDGDTITGVCNIGIPNSFGSYATIIHGNHSETRTSGGNFSNFTYNKKDGAIIMIHYATSGENFDLAKVGTGLIYRLSGNGVRNTAHIYGVGNEVGAPTYLETLDKLDQWSSAQYIPNSGNKLNL